MRAAKIKTSSAGKNHVPNNTSPYSLQPRTWKYLPTSHHLSLALHLGSHTWSFFHKWSFSFSASFIKFAIMYRQSFAPPPAHSPPLHHPVPQHVSTVPMMRSPPPPTSQQPQTSAYGNPYQPAPAQGGSGTYAPGFGGFINDPTAQMGFHMGKTAMAAGQEYMEQNVCWP